MKPKAIYSADKDYYKIVFSDEIRERIESVVDIVGNISTPLEVEKNSELLKNVEFVFSTWGAVSIDDHFLENAPNLKAVFHAGGSVRAVTSDAFWERDDLMITTASRANAIPVAEYCLSMILFSLKLGFRHIYNLQSTHMWEHEESVPGAFFSRVGLVSLGEIGRKTLDLLKPFDLNISVYSTSLTDEKEEELGVKSVSLEELFKTCDVISVHTADLPETRKMINKRLLKSMKKDATLINTSRGSLIDQDALIDVLNVRTDLTAVLDVTYPEPPVDSSGLYDVPNIILTPHIAGSMYGETARMAYFAYEACKEYLAGETPKWVVTREQFERMA